MAPSSQRPRRGRPPTFSPRDREDLAELIRQHGIRGTTRLVPFRVSAETLIKIGREFGVVLARGKRPGQLRAPVDSTRVHSLDHPTNNLMGTRTEA